MAAPFSRTTRALQSDGAGLAWWAWGAAGLGLLAWAGWFSLAQVTVFEVSRKARLEVNLAPQVLAAQQAGALASTQLRIGQVVQAGEVLAELDTTPARLQLAEERTHGQAVPPKIASLKAELAAQAQALAAEQRAHQAAVQAAQARLQQTAAAIAFAQDQAGRLRTEAQRGGVAEVDALRAAADTDRLLAEREAQAADLRRLQLDAGTRSQQAQVQAEALRRQVLALEGELAGSNAASARLSQQVERLRVRAPVAGVVAEVQPLAPGAHVAEGQKLATIVPPGELVIVADFDPASALGRLRPGQPARLKLDGFPWGQYGSVSAQVQRVAGEVRDNGLRVELRPDAPAAPATTGRPAPPLQHGLSGSVEVGIEQASPALLLLRAIGRPWAATP